MTHSPATSYRHAHENHTRINCFLEPHCLRRKFLEQFCCRGRRRFGSIDRRNLAREGDIRVRYRARQHSHRQRGRSLHQRCGGPHHALRGRRTGFPYHEWRSLHGWRQFWPNRFYHRPGRSNGLLVFGRLGLGNIGDFRIVRASTDVDLELDQHHRAGSNVAGRLDRLHLRQAL